MDRMDIHISDFAKICRICLGTDEEMKRLFPDGFHKVEVMEEVTKMIDDFIIYPISRNDKLPNNICLKCIEQVRTTYNFKNQCERSFELLTSILETYNSGFKNIQGESGKDEKSESLSIKVEDPLEFIETISNDDEFNCTYCAKSFSQDINLRKHISVLHTNVGNICSLCDKHCGTPTKMEKHISVCHSRNSMKYLIKCENREDVVNLKQALGGSDNSYGGNNVVETMCEPKKDNKSKIFELDNDDSYYSFNGETSDKNDAENEDDRPSLAGFYKIKIKQEEGNDSPAKTDTNDKQSESENDLPSKKDYKCDICDKSFTSWASLKQHKITHLDQKPFVCQVCGKGFSRTILLRNHQLYHHEKDFPLKWDYICDICNKPFTNSAGLKQHKITHLKEKPFICEVCDKSFSRIVLLKNHQLFHHENDSPSKWKHKCDICNKYFTSTGILNQHKITHLKEKPFVCQICDKGFSRAVQLRTHQFGHQNVKPYVCHECGQGFSRSDGLRRHQLRHHGDISPSKRGQKCNVCNKFFKRSSHLKHHMKTHTDCELSLQNYPETLESEQDMTKYTKNHTIETPSCITRIDNFVRKTEQQFTVTLNKSKKIEEEIGDEYLQIEVKEEGVNV